LNKLTVAFSCLLAACGGGEPVHKGTVNPTGARTTVESVHDVFAAMDSANGASAADAVLALTAAGQIVIAPGAAREEMPQEAGSATCDSNGCTFDHYGDTFEGYTYSIDGSIRRSGDTLTFDLTYDVTSSGFNFHWEMDGHLTVSSTLIDGDVHAHGDADVSSDGRNYNIGWDFDVDYNSIGLDGSGCPISGSLTAEVAYSVSGAQSGSYRAAGSVTFGPSCGQVR